ncbi:MULTISPECIES: hypothetical protein [Acinetobacter]|uniref:Uncharacterized protein n=1 Tax=Acinetobacter kyonggiensis TaxID=595670 RepID=A0A1H3G6Z5_9GAMM|nr:MULTISPECIES: hypothetical protein [Acinetobacter]OTH00854.1 hypothetical protein B9T30_01890 [Acinetobacter sp. ANC 4973]SDX98825.1 hypothetical protein SAMN05421643_10230 [Acinetobacter kyonggiensis]
MSDFSNVTVTHNDDDSVSLLIDQKPISERYGMNFSATIVDELKALTTGQSLKLFEQFVFSHTDLNFEHSYRYVTCVINQESGYITSSNFVYKITAVDQQPIEHVITKQGQAMTAEDVREFINAHLQKSLSDYTDLKYAY